MTFIVRVRYLRRLEHLIALSFRNEPTDSQTDDYDWAVNAENLDAALERIYADFNDGRARREYRVRNMSIGDRVALDAGYGRVFRCEAMGWKEIVDT